jgi:hypothetical protein
MAFTDSASLFPMFLTGILILNSVPGVIAAGLVVAAPTRKSACEAIFKLILFSSDFFLSSSPM